MTMRGTARRQNDRNRMRLAAAERVGHENAYWILFGWPTVRTAAPVLLTGLGLWWLWENVDRSRLVMVVAVLGIVCLVTYAGAVIATAARRRGFRAAGTRLHTGWHFVALAGVVLTVAAYLAAGAA